MTRDPLRRLADRILRVGFRRKVVDVDGRPIDDGAPGDPIPVDRPPLERRNRPVGGGWNEQVAVQAIDLGIARVAQLSRMPGHRVQDRLEIGRRARDHAQDLARGRLLLQRRGEIGVPGLQLAEQPRVVDGDHRLVGEGPQQRQLGVGEAARLGASDPDHDAEVRPAEHGDHRHRVETAPPGMVADERAPGGVGVDVGDVLYRPGQDRPSIGNVRVGRVWRRQLLREGFAAPGQAAACGHQLDEPVLVTVDRGGPCPEEAQGALGDRLEDGLHVGGRGRDQAQDGAGGRLPIGRLGQFLLEPGPPGPLLGERRLQGLDQSGQVSVGLRRHSSASERSKWSATL